MLRNVSTAFIPKRVGEDIIVAKVARGTASNRWQAQRLINALRSKVALEHIALDVVVIDGDPNQEPTVIGSSTVAEVFVRRSLPQLAEYPWKSATLDW